MGKELLGSLELNRIYQMDCLEGLKLIPDSSIDMILCDLPYGITGCSWDSVIPLEPLWEQYIRIIKDNSGIVLTASQPFTGALVMSNPKMYKCEWIWEKNAGSNFGTVKYHPMKEHESVLVFSKGKVKYRPIMQERAEAGKERAKYDVNINTKTENYANSLHNQITLRVGELRYPRSIQKFNIPKGKEKFAHPTQKPVNMFEYFIKTYSDENDIILDNCMGSGTTAVAAIKSNRKFIGFETESKYIEVANQRIESTYNEIDDEKILSKLN
jgi:site-specific DNA-methyltransferase (adenine-specific)